MTDKDLAKVLTTARAEAREAALEEAAKACDEVANSEASLQTFARTGGDAKNAIIHGYAADTLRFAARNIRALIEHEKEG